jgi:hypothetical protein
VKQRMIGGYLAEKNRAARHHHQAPPQIGPSIDFIALSHT